MVATVATAATALFARASCVDRQQAAANFRAVELRDDLLSVFVAHVDNRKALRLVGVALGDNSHGFDPASLFKQREAGRHGPLCAWCATPGFAFRSVIRKRALQAPTWENAGKDHHRRCSPLGIKIRRDRGKDRDISEVLRAEHRPEPRGHWGTRYPGNVEVVLFLSLHVRPRMEGDASVFSLVLLDITVHGLSSPLLWPLTSALIEPVLAATRDCTCAHTL
jgi:hypothetical protein